MNYQYRPSTEFAAFHGASGVLADAVAAVPGYRAAADQFTTTFATLQTYMAGLSAPRPVDAVQTLADLLASGEPLPASLPADLYDGSRNVTAQYQHLEQAADAVLQTLAGARDNTLSAGRDAIVAHLDGVLRACVAEARAVDLRGADDAESAIAHGVGDDWMRLTALRAQYREVRAAQTVVMRLLYRETDDRLISTHGFLRNFAEMVPDWHDILRGPTTELYLGRAEEGSRGGVWPWIATPATLTTDASVDDDDARFAWLIDTPAAQPWVPTAEQMREAHAVAVAARRAGLPKPDRSAAARVDREYKRARNEAAARQESVAHLRTPRPGYDTLGNPV